MLPRTAAFASKLGHPAGELQGMVVAQPDEAGARGRVGRVRGFSLTRWERAGIGCPDVNRRTRRPGRTPNPPHTRAESHARPRSGRVVPSLNEGFQSSIKRNRERFPEDFAFLLTRQEAARLRSQIVTLKGGRGRHSKYAPYAFTQEGVAMLSAVLPVNALYKQASPSCAPSSGSAK
jgi:hypothetical protein